jgi:hypothetical protein
MADLCRRLFATLISKEFFFNRFSSLRVYLLVFKMFTYKAMC